MFTIHIFADIWHPAIEVEGQPNIPARRARELVVSYKTPHPAIYQKLLRRSNARRKSGLWSESSFIIVQEDSRIRRFQFVQMNRANGFPKRRWVECKRFYKGYADTWEWGSETPYHDWLRAATILEKDKESKQVMLAA